MNFYVKKVKTQNWIGQLKTRTYWFEYHIILERTRGIEPPSQPWQGRVLTIEPRSQIKMEGPNGFEPMIRVLQTHALPLG